VKADKAAKPPSAADIKAFMADADKAEAAPSYDTKAAATMVKSGKHAAKAGVAYKPAAATPANGAPPPAAPATAADEVYETYQKMH
jgi:hypothetical protein